jgi:hypothetical protein
MGVASVSMPTMVIVPTLPLRASMAKAEAYSDIGTGGWAKLFYWMSFLP